MRGRKWKDAPDAGDPILNGHYGCIIVPGEPPPYIWIDRAGVTHHEPAGGPRSREFCEEAALLLGKILNDYAGEER